jgi:hypothetical protein
VPRPALELALEQFLGSGAGGGAVGSDRGHQKGMSSLADAPIVSSASSASTASASQSSPSSSRSTATLIPVKSRRVSWPGGGARGIGHGCWHPGHAPSRQKPLLVASLFAWGRRQWGVRVPAPVPSRREPSVQAGCIRLSTGGEPVDQLGDAGQALLERQRNTFRCARRRGLSVGATDGAATSSSGCRDVRSSAAIRRNSDSVSPRSSAAPSQRFRAAGLARNLTCLSSGRIAGVCRDRKTAVWGGWRKRASTRCRSLAHSEPTW